ncbi:MAG TPA: hypothetical protein VMW45_04485 [Dehalococcoidia bacterium]|nr:hypothetical protein [Dehalococcoidia bacterium]
MTKRIDALEGTLITLENMATGYRTHRDDIFQNEIGDIIVDSVKATDTDRWETGVSSDKGRHWVIVQQYRFRLLAKLGHIIWVKRMKSNPNRKLKDIDVWNIGIDQNEKQR